MKNLAVLDECPPQCVDETAHENCVSCTLYSRAFTAVPDKCYPARRSYFTSIVGEREKKRWEKRKIFIRPSTNARSSFVCSHPLHFLQESQWPPLTGLLQGQCTGLPLIVT